MKFTIGILVSDKDLSNLETLVSHVQERVKIPHEIIICNNSSQPISLKNLVNVFVVNNGNGNIYQLRGRKLIIEQAESDYIWFVDGDDDVNEVEDIEFTSDIVTFNYDRLYDNIQTHINLLKEEEIIESDDFFEEKNLYLNKTLWNCFIKTSIFKEVIKEIPDENVSCGEDWIYIFGCLKYAKTYEKRLNYYYIFNETESSSMLFDFSDNYNAFERILFGVDKSIALLQKITDNRVDKLLEKPLIEFFVEYFVKKIIFTTNDDVCLQMFDRLREYFSDNDILHSFTVLIKDFNISEKEFNRLKNIITQRVGFKCFFSNFDTLRNLEIQYDFFKYDTDNLYQDKDIEGHPFTLNCNTGEVEIFRKKDDKHFWVEKGQKWYFIDNSVTEDEYIIHFSFGNACNLNCTYCFANKANTHELCLEEQKDVIDRVFELYGGKIKHIVLNNSGEPLYNSERFWEMYDYIISKGLPENKIYFNTNGVDYSEYDIKRLVNKGEINISIDGMKEIQDAHRGEGTYDSIIEDIQAMKENNCELYATAVIMDDKMPIFDILEHLYNIGFTYQIYFSPARIDGYWTLERKVRLCNRYEEFFKELEKRVCEKRELHWLASFAVQLTRISTATFYKNCPRDEYNFIDVDSKGNVFVCYEEVGDNSKIKANIFTSDMEELKNQRIQNLKKKNEISDSCILENCPFINFCGGKNNFCERSDKDMLCQIEKIKYKYLLKIFAYLKNYYLPEEREFIFEDTDHRSMLLEKNPQLLMLDKEFAKTWFYRKSTQDRFKDGTLNKEDFEAFM